MRPRASKRLAPALVVALVLAGCGDPGPDGAAPPGLEDLRWPTLTVRTTPSEPFELTRPIYVTWRDGLFAIWAESETNLRRRTIVDGDTAWVNQNAGMGWTRFALDQDLYANDERLVVWDLPRIVAQEGMAITGNVTEGTLLARVAGPVATPRGPVEVALELRARNGVVAFVRESSPVAREAPFTFTDEGVPFPFPIAVPTLVLGHDDASRGNTASTTAHVTVIKLVQDYQATHAGTVPDEPSPQSLQVELLRSGASWPTNAFTGAPLAVGNRPGDIGWQKTAPGDASYTGFGWDGPVISESF